MSSALNLSCAACALTSSLNSTAMMRPGAQRPSVLPTSTHTWSAWICCTTPTIDGGGSTIAETDAATAGPPAAPVPIETRYGSAGSNDSVGSCPAVTFWNTNCLQVSLRVGHDQAQRVRLRVGNAGHPDRA